MSLALMSTLGLAAGVGLAAASGPTWDLALGTPLARTEPFRVLFTDNSGTSEWLQPANGAWQGEVRGGVEIGPAGWAQGHIGAAYRHWGARYEGEPNSLVPRVHDAELTAGVVWQPGTRFRQGRDLDPAVRSVLTWDLGLGQSLLTMRPWSATSGTTLPLSFGAGLDIALGETSVRVMARSWLPLLLGSASGTGESVLGTTTWSFETGTGGVSLLVGVVRNRRADYPRPLERRRPAG